MTTSPIKKLSSSLVMALIFILIVLSYFIFRVSSSTASISTKEFIQEYTNKHRVPEQAKDVIIKEPTIPRVLTFQSKLAQQAEARLESVVTYNGNYRKIAYPMGDVPENIGVCTDVVIRSYRGLGIDLQQRVHEDMRKNFSVYPKIWKLKQPRRCIITYH